MIRAVRQPLALLVLAALVGTAAFAQQVADEAAERAGGVEEPSAGIVLDHEQGVRYDAEGRRDPFRSLIARAQERGPRLPGIRGMSVAELVLTGIVVSDEGPIAVFRGSDGKTYYLRTGAQVYDGTLVRISYEERTAVFKQVVSDLLQRDGYRDVEKKLGRVQE